MPTWQQQRQAGPKSGLSHETCRTLCPSCEVPRSRYSNARSARLPHHHKKPSFQIGFDDGPKFVSFQIEPVLFSSTLLALFIAEILLFVFDCSSIRSSILDSWYLQHVD